jgi:protein SCO1
MRSQHSKRSPILAVLILAVMTLTPVGLSPAAAPPVSPWAATYFPNVPLVTQDGQTVRFYDDLLKGKTVVINSLYTHCDACLLETAKLAQVQQFLGDRVGRDIFLYSITVDPARDTPAALKAYADRVHAGPGWLFLTGEQTAIDAIRQKLGLYAARDTADPFHHTAKLAIGNEATGHWMRRSAVDSPQFLALTVDNLLPRGGSRQPGRSYTETAPLAVRGEYLFATRCVLCHTIGQGDGDGPDLRGVTSRRDRAWLARWLAGPDRMLAEGDPTATALMARYSNNEMPNLLLRARDVDALLAYLEERTTALQGPEGKDSRAAR